MLIVLRPPKEAHAEFPALGTQEQKPLPVKLRWVHLGEVVSLNDARFTQENGKLGLWTPVQFIEEHGAGIYLLQPYEPTKIPVLFVHGVGGYPMEWSNVVDQLNTERFQPWVLHYPSGLRLDMLAEGLHRMVDELQAKHHFDALNIVAHSMGGLVSRGFINHHVAENDPPFVKCFVTLSTPWQGHQSAQLGVDHAPAAVPSWYDMVPGSPYLQSLFEKSLPPEITCHLLFSYQGKPSFLNDANNDGTVTLWSQLHLPAQLEAAKVIGFDEDHTSILNAEKVHQTLNEILIDRIRVSKKVNRWDPLPKK